MGDVIAMSVAHRNQRLWRVRRYRLLILGVALLALAIKLLLASVTYGTNDITIWLNFTRAVKVLGPIRIYGLHDPLYNHPPLIGYFLVAINFLTHFGFSQKFSIRAAASLADVVSALLLFEVLRHRRSLREAAGAGVLIAASPVLITVSGYHGNTDPVFTMLTLLSLYLLADRRMPASAGVALAAAVSIKLVPVVVVPTLLLYAASKGRVTLIRFAGALIVVVLIIWTPAVLSEWSSIRYDVLGYSGMDVHPWGLPQFSQWLGFSGLSQWLDNSGKLVAAVCAVVPAIVVWRRPRFVAEATGLAITGFLLLSPAFGVQYLVWPLLFAYLLSFWWATAYNLLAGGLLVEVYTRWNGTFLWNRAISRNLVPVEKSWAALVWFTLAGAISQGIWRTTTTPGIRTPTRDSPPILEEAIDGGAGHRAASRERRDGPQQDLDAPGYAEAIPGRASLPHKRNPGL